NAQHVLNVQAVRQTVASAIAAADGDDPECGRVARHAAAGVRGDAAHLVGAHAGARLNADLGRTRERHRREREGAASTWERKRVAAQRLPDTNGGLDLP